MGALLVPAPAQAASTVGAGTWENTSSVIKYKGSWKTSKSSQDSGGSVRRLNASGYAQLTFTTSGVRWVTRKTSGSGIADVYVDGTKKATVDLYSPTTQRQQVAYEVTGLPTAGTHTIKIVRTGKKNAKSSGKSIQLDAFVTPDVVAPAAPSGLTSKITGDDVTLTWSANAESDVKSYQVFRRVGTRGDRTLIATTTAKVRTATDPGRLPGETDLYDVVATDTSGNVSPASSALSVQLPITPRGAGTYDEKNPAVGLRGPWTSTSSTQDVAGAHASLKAAGYAQLTFSTSSIRWISRLDSYSGIADVYLDGVKQTSVDLYAATAKAQYVAYEVKDLPAGPHTLRVVWTGTKNPAASATTITLDAFVAPDLVAPAAPTGLTAVASGTDVVLTWARSTEPDLTTYEVREREGSSTTLRSVGTFPAGTTTTTVLGRAQGSTFTYDLVATDTSGNVSAPSRGASVTIPIKPEGAGTYENDSAEVTLDGTWSVIPSKLDSGGSYSSLDGPGFAQVSFNTSGIRWISRVNNYSGIADVYLDGVKQKSVDLYSPSTKFQQVVYEVKGLPETPHTLRIVRTGTKSPSSNSTQILLDAFLAPNVFPPAAPRDVAPTPVPGGVQLDWTASPEADVSSYRVYRGAATGNLTAVGTQPADDTDYVDTGLQPGATYRYQVTALNTSGTESARSEIITTTVPMTALPAGTYEDGSPSVTQQGDWTKASSTYDSGGSISSLTGTGYAEMSFATSGIRWVTRTNAYSGIADVWIDGRKQESVDLYSAGTKTGQTVFEVKGLSETGHTIRIAWTGTKNAASTGKGISLDAFVAPDIYAPAAPQALTETPVRSGVKLLWKKNAERDVASYRLLRRTAGSSTAVLVGTTDPATTSFTDVGLANGVSYSWTVVARDTSGNDSPASNAAVLTTGGDPYATFAYRYAKCPTATVTVSTRAQLLTAIKAGTSGTVIRLNPGSYGSGYLINTKATAANPMWICGPDTAVFDNNDFTKGYGFQVNGANNVVLAGMTVRNVQKGVSVQYAKNVTIADMRVERIGDEAIHLKNMTTDSTVIGNSVDTTGLNAKNYGEGVYIGTAQGNWCKYNNCQPDNSDRNVVAYNVIKNNTAESIEAKAGTNDGTMWKNTMDGSTITADDADSLIQIMGSGWVVAGSKGSNSPEDAIQIWNTDDGSYGFDNVVYDNAVAVGPPPGYVVHLPYVNDGNVAGCDNSRGAKGLSNVPCQN
ncbi:fibronectin type III domain-containing protein [Microlunatus antarcticus]|uniref:Fibronectin type 3 domain-containing protein n=1 Tax=Microlunatus antarcticus TaxID=53388 RepID=A0A7W5JWY8_9ACTN|nr:fibronectin type 3 domain-containing protein [Microlunatus antarcticus]